ncbi:C2 NT-type domain-containing protein [Lamellibrachia satsuma]|nr:C2 NT-type domain-containing protein [Lamellibrachia satsuma]
MLKKKRFKFQVLFEVAELSSVPFVNGVLYAKVRLLDGGSFTEFTSREEVCHHQVRWQQKYQFTCKMTASITSGVLDPCICRVSIRKEVKGGKSSQKLGFADVNLSQYAGAGSSSRRYLLKGYDSRSRQDNSMLKVNISMTLLSGDPCFKAPKSKSLMLPGRGEEEDLQPENKGASDDDSTGSIASNSSGFGSLPRPNYAESVDDVSGGESTMSKRAAIAAATSACLSHKRSGSSGSSYSRASDSPSVSHSRQSSTGLFLPTHVRSGSIESGRSEPSKSGSVRQHAVRKLETSACIEKKVCSTRLDADELVNELIQATDFQSEDSPEVSGLQLYVGRDGSTVLGSRQSSHQIVGAFEQVIIERR